MIPGGQLEEGYGGVQTKFSVSVSPGPGLNPGTLDFLDLTWDLDLSMTIKIFCGNVNKLM